MSPEQAELNALDVDTRSDIYSLGVILYELLTGTTPLDGEQLRSAAYEEMQRLIREETPPKPSTRVSTAAQTSATRHTANRRALQGDLDWIAMKALEKDRARRYETANALALDIGRHLRDEPVSAGPPSASYRMKKFVRRNRRSLLSGAVAAVALLMGLSVAGVLWLNERERMTKVEEQAGTLITQAENLMEINVVADDYYDDEAFRRAEVLVEQLTLLGDLDQAGDALRVRHEQLVVEVQSERRDRNLIRGIEEALMMGMGSGSGGSMEEMREEEESAFAEAFNLHGTNPAKQPVAETGAWLKQRREEVRSRILAGMLEWADLQKEESPASAERIQTVVATLDLDPWRKKLRRAIDEKDRAALESLAAESGEIGQQTIMTILSIAPALRAAGLDAAMEELLRQAQREHPENFWTNFALGSTLKKSRDATGYASGKEGFEASVSLVGYSKLRPELDEAIGFLRAAVAARPDAAGGWLSLGLILTHGGHLQEAVASSQRAVELKPDLVAAHINLGIALSKQSKLDEAIASYRKAIDLDPDMAIAHSNLGAALVEQGKLDQATASHREALKLDPENAKSHNNLSRALMMQGKLDEAIVSLRTAIELDPDFAAAHSNLGGALMMQGKPGEAIAPSRRAIDLDPENAVAHNTLGNALMMQGKLDEAVASLGRAIELNSEIAKAHNNLGIALMMQGKLDQAIEAIRESLRLKPNPRTLSGTQALQEKDEQLLGIVREDGAGNRSVPALVREILSMVPFSDPPQESVREFWKNHREEVADALGSATVRIITRLKEGPIDDPGRTPESQKVMIEDLRKTLGDDADFDALAKEHSDFYDEERGSLREVKRGYDLVGDLDHAAFSLNEGGLSEVIEDRRAYYLLKVESRQPGKADDFDDPGVKKAAGELFNEVRREKWETNYLKRLQERRKEEDAGNPAEAKDAE